MELAAVAAIMGVLALVAVPALTSLDAARAATAAASLERDLAYVRQKAVGTGLTTWATFSTAQQTGTFLIELRATPGRATAAPLADPAALGRAGGHYTVRFGQEPLRGVQLLAADFAGQQEVGFDWRGRALRSGGALLATPGTLRLTGGWVVRVEPDSGLITAVAP